MKTGVLLIGMGALVYALIRTTAAWYVNNDGGADFVIISREVAA